MGDASGRPERSHCRKFRGVAASIVVKAPERRGIHNAPGKRGKDVRPAKSAGRPMARSDSDLDHFAHCVADYGSMAEVWK